LWGCVCMGVEIIHVYIYYKDARALSGVGGKRVRKKAQAF